ncbi:MAG: hypothetical protein IRF12RH_07020 [Rickettsia helvetica]|uniref:Uncharacterized protein n=1 Tax=Rickettsia helvetica TaxID=35789 RepID=A0ABM9ND66_RICHE
MFGFAKPVIYNPVYFKKPKRDMILVGLAGLLSNFLLATIAFTTIFLIHNFHIDLIKCAYEVLKQYDNNKFNIMLF